MEILGIEITSKDYQLKGYAGACCQINIRSYLKAVTKKTGSKITTEELLKFQNISQKNDSLKNKKGVSQKNEAEIEAETELFKKICNTEAFKTYQTLTKECQQALISENISEEQKTRLNEKIELLTKQMEFSLVTEVLADQTESGTNFQKEIFDNEMLANTLLLEKQFEIYSLFLQSSGKFDTEEIEKAKKLEFSYQSFLEILKGVQKENKENDMASALTNFFLSIQSTQKT